MEKIKNVLIGAVNYVKETFSDGKYSSSARWLALYLTTIGATLACYGLYLGVEPVGLAALATVFIGGAVTNQQLGKRQERLIEEFKDVIDE